MIKTINTLGWLKTHLLTAAHTAHNVPTSQRMYLNQNSHKNMKNYLLWFGWYWFSPSTDVWCCNRYEHLSMQWINLKWHRNKKSTSISKKEYHISEWLLLHRKRCHTFWVSAAFLGCRCDAQFLQRMKIDDNNDFRLQTLWKSKLQGTENTFHSKKIALYRIYHGTNELNLLLTLCTLHNENNSSKEFVIVSYFECECRSECISFFSSFVRIIFLQTKILFKHNGEKFCIGVKVNIGVNIYSHKCWVMT